MKHALFGILEALENLVGSGQRPERSFYLAFGHDEEVGGIQGAGHISKHIQDSLRQVWQLTHFLLFAFSKKIVICLDGKSMTPHRKGNFCLLFLLVTLS